MEMKEMEIKEYWDNFYKLNIAPTKESSFASFVYNFMVENNLTNKKLIDVACGNGRDTNYFTDCEIASYGVDLSAHFQDDGRFYQENILLFNYEGFEVLYLRFIVHAIPEADLDQLLERIKSTSPNAILFIETRSSKGVTDEPKSETYFKSPIGKEHFRMLYSKDYLKQKFESKFDVLFEEEGTGMSVFKGSDPVCIRFVLKCKNS